MRASLCLTAVLGCAALPAFGATVGYTDDFNSGIGNWGGGSSYEVVASGGVGGAGDGYLRVFNDFDRQLAVRNSGPEFGGNLIADGVTGFSFWLSDLGTADSLEIHFAIGPAFVNMWQYNVPFPLPTDGWAFYTVDFTDPGNWTQTLGSGTLQDALAGTDRLQFRHDNAPYDQLPPFVTGDFGVDRVTVLPEPASVMLLGVGLMLLRRR